MRFGAADSDPLDAGRQLGVDAVVDGHVYISGGPSEADGPPARRRRRRLALGRAATRRDSASCSRCRILSRRSSQYALSAVAFGGDAIGRDRKRNVGRRGLAATMRMVDFKSNAATPRACDARSISSRAALRRDPRFALASAGLSDAYALGP